MKLKICGGLRFFEVMSGKTLIALSVAVLAMAAGLVAQTATPTTQRANRITQEMSAGANVAMAGTVHPLTRRATDLGAVDSNLQLGSMTLNVGLSAAQETEVNALLEAVQDPKSAQYHQWLTQEEYGARFGLTSADLSKVTAWLTEQGFTVQRVSKTRNAISFSGKAWQVESAFHTQLHQFQMDGETHFANTTELRVPAAMGSVAVDVRGLNNFRLKPQMQKRVKPAYTVNTSLGITNFIGPGDWATIYGVTTIYNAGYTGTGAHVGVVGQTYAPQADIDHFRSAAGLGTTNLSYVCIDTTAAHCTGTAAISTTGDLGEADLDIEWAGGIAKNATVDYVYAPYSDVTNNTLGVLDALAYAVQNYTVPSTGKVLPVISMSYGDCEESLTTAYVNFVTSLGQQAGLLGQTIVASSGDSGTAVCDATNYPAKLGVSAGVPTDSPLFTGVGGTTLSGDETTPSTYWNETLNVVNSALSYIPETVWNDTSSTQLSASSGGVSLWFPQPSWQPTPANYTGVAGRFEPDVAFAASPEHDGYVTCSQDNTSTLTGTDCTSGFVSSNKYFDIAGGTSAGAPSFAGMLTLLTQKYGSMGNINPTLYKIAKNAPTVFHDVTSGNNNVPCTVVGTDPVCVNGTMGYSATAGYDLTTGLGSMDGGALLNTLATVSSLGAATTTTISDPASSLTLGGTTTLTATVNSATAGVITGMVTFQAANGTLGAATVSGGVATLSNTTVSVAKGFSAGNDTITATYGGDVNYAASSAGMTLPVAWPYTLVASANAVTGSSTVGLTLNSSNYAGTVSFLTSVTLNGVASNAITASASPVTLTSGGSGSSTLTITTSTSAANHAPAVPWKSGVAIVFGAVLLGAPFTGGRKRAMAVLLIASTIVLAGFLMACGNSAKAPRTYTVVVTPSGAGTTTNPSAISVVVTVP